MLSDILKKVYLLAPEDVRLWAGSTDYNRGKAYLGQVEQLAHDNEGRLAAFVRGRKRYVTTVAVNEDGEIEGACSCPVGSWCCKHSVAVLLKAIGMLENNVEIPLLLPEDDLSLLMNNWDEKSGFDQLIPESPSKFNTGAELTAILTSKSKEELIALICELAERNIGIKKRLLEENRLLKGDIETTIRRLKQEIIRVSEEEVWTDHWSNEGNIPDYSHIRDQLGLLAKAGYADAVLELGGELWTRGVKQIEMSCDDGQTSCNIAECFKIIIHTLPQTSRTPVQQILWMVHHLRQDDHDLLGACSDIMNHPTYTAECWREAASFFETELSEPSTPQINHCGQQYDRKDSLFWLKFCYERGDQNHKVIPLLERELESCMCYEELAHCLLETNQWERARQICIEGFRKLIGSQSGQAQRLQDRLKIIAGKEGRLDMVAAYSSLEFFASVSLQTYQELRKACQASKEWPSVRALILEYLETGRRPDRQKKGKDKPCWPLPNPEIEIKKNEEKSDRFHCFPMLAILIDIAIDEKRLDDAALLYERQKKARNGKVWDDDREVAEALAQSHPELALNICKALTDNLIARVKPEAYVEACSHLLLMYDIYQAQFRLEEWTALISRLRTEHKTKRRLLSELEDLCLGINRRSKRNQEKA